MRERDSMFGPYDDYFLDELELKRQEFVEHLKQEGFKKTESGDYTNGLMSFEHPLCVIRPSVAKHSAILNPSPQGRLRPVW